MRNYPEIGLQVPDVLIPADSISLEKWAVVACDQYTSQPEYWEQVNQIAKNAPSTYHLILPEAYLGKPEEIEHLAQINSSMADYLGKGYFEPLEGFIYIERTLDSKVRNGLIAALDLEQYDFNKDSKSIIRATEGTIIDRLPPRIKIREKALLEIPHIMVLIDDPQFTVIEPLSDAAGTFNKLYDFKLMMGGGNIKGYRIDNPKIERTIVNALSALASEEAQNQKYQIKNTPLLFAVGDGNHSLATAKSIWEKIKIRVAQDHPARYALVEIVNIHNDGIQFEPIHRIVKNIKIDLLEALSKFFSGNIAIKTFQTYETMTQFVKNQKSNSQIIGSVFGDEIRTIVINNPFHTLPVGSLQYFLDDLILSHPEIILDFIHGDEALLSLARQPHCMGFFLPAMEKSSLFKSVIKDGPLPRKTFSMGEAHEKRFYLECRKIQGADYYA